MIPPSLDMRFVLIKSRLRGRRCPFIRTRGPLVKQRTRQVNMMRSLLGEFGIDIPEGLPCPEHGTAGG